MRRLMWVIVTGMIVGLTNSQAPADPPPAPEGYKWVRNEAFWDDFEGDRLDETKWYDHHPRWKGRPPAKFVPEAVSVQDGCLVIRNRMLDEPDGPYTIGGGAVVSKSDQAHYGYYEVRMKASKVSMSSTFWFSNKPVREGDRKTAQELDVQETVGAPKRSKNRHMGMFSNTHHWVWEKGEKFDEAVGDHAPLPSPAGEEFHVYGVWWVDPNTIHFYLNGKYVYTIHPSTKFDETPFDRPMWLNLVTETYNWETPPTPDELADDSRNATYYDYVHAWKLVPAE
ncbi:hypothetical protein JCM19992_00620 [Thermostilla marina]